VTPARLSPPRTSALQQAAERHRLEVLSGALTIMTAWGLPETRRARLLRMRPGTLRRVLAAGDSPYRPRLTGAHTRRINLIVQLYVTLTLAGGKEHAERWPNDDPTFLGLTPIEYVDLHGIEAFFLACRSAPVDRP
jgi:hypothetical protein